MSELNILMSFKAHHLIFNNDHLEDERIELLNEMEKSMIENHVNREVRKRIIENAKNKYDKDNDNIIPFLLSDTVIPEKMELRSNIDYKVSYDILNEFLIDNNLTAERHKEMYQYKRNKKEIEPEELILELPELM